MSVVGPSRRTSVALTGLFALSLLLPSAGMACDRGRSSCPGMPKQLAALCHRAGQLAPPMDCCAKRRAASEAPTSPRVPPPAEKAGAAATPAAMASVPALAVPEIAAVPELGCEQSRAGRALDLNILFAVFRI